MKVVDVLGLVQVGLFLVAGCYCLYLNQPETAYALFGVAGGGLFIKRPVELAK